MSYGGNCDEIFRNHKRNIEECLWQIVASVEANIDGKKQSESYMKYLFGFLHNRLLTLSKNVQTKCFECKLAAPIDHGSLQRGVDEKQRIREMVDKLLNAIPNELLTTNDQNVKNVATKTASELGLDHYIDHCRELQQGKTDNVPEFGTKRRKFSEQSKIDENLVALKENRQVDRPSPRMADKLRRQTYAILGATSRCNMISQTCFLCEQTLIFDFVGWKNHILSHTGTEDLPSNDTHFHNGFQLKGYMCKICDYFKVYPSQIQYHVVKEHRETPKSALDYIEMVMLMPNLRRFNNHIITKHKHVSSKQRYLCGIRGCEMNFGNSANFRLHFMTNHRHARIFHCLHCGEAIRCDDDESEVKLSTIQSHMNLHGSVVIECSICSSQFSNDSNVITHMLVRHASVNFMYRRDFRDGILICRMEQVIVLLECCWCKSRFDTTAQALHHYLRIHKSHHADFEIILLMKKSALDNGLVSYSMEDMDPRLRFQQNFICGWCHIYFKTKHYLIDHHNSMHRPKNLALEFSRNCWTNEELLTEQNLDFDQYLLYYCVHCNDSIAYADAEEVYNHWIDNHNEEGNSKPFRFTVAQLAQCHYCAVISTFEGLKKHQPEQHPRVSFIIDDLNDRSKCGLCLDEDVNASRTHFENKHQAVLKADLFSPIPLSNGILKKLTNIKGEKKRKCRYCAGIFETKDEFQSHHSKEHQLVEPHSEKSYDNESVHLIAGCCEAKLEPNQLFTHLKEHTILSKHRLKQYYWETLIICGNGLVLNKHNLLGTEHDDSQEFDDFIKEITNSK